MLTPFPKADSLILYIAQSAGAVEYISAEG